MKILMVSQAVPFLPCHDGFRLIPANLLKELSKRHEIHLISLSDGTEATDELTWARRHTADSIIVPLGPASRDPLVRLKRLLNEPFPQLLAPVRDAVLALQPDVVHIEGHSLAPLVRVLRNSRAILSAHDCVSLRYSQFMPYANDVQQRFRYWVYKCHALHIERMWYSKMQRVIVTSPADAEALTQYVRRDRLSIIPNGIDLPRWLYKPDPIPGRIVFTGNMSWGPNEDAAEFFANECFDEIRRDHPKAEFWIVGASPSKRVQRLARSGQVIVTGTVPDIRSHVWPASVYVSPIRYGAGVKNKILEAMALGAPIVATRQSLTGTPVEDGKHMLIANSAAEIIRAVSDLLDDQQLASRLSLNARRLIEDKYYWPAIAERFEEQWQTAASSCPAQLTPTMVASNKRANTVAAALDARG